MACHIEIKANLNLYKPVGLGRVVLRKRESSNGIPYLSCKKQTSLLSTFVNFKETNSQKKKPTTCVKPVLIKPLPQRNTQMNDHSLSSLASRRRN